jgi:hypothetical protein
MLPFNEEDPMPEHNPDPNAMPGHDADPSNKPVLLVPPSAEIQRPGQLLRIAAMVRELLADVRASTPDEAGRKRLREVYERALSALREGLSADLQHELNTLTIPLEGTPSESEIRLAQAQLVGWLEGLFQGIQAAMWAQHVQAQAQVEEMRRRGLALHGGDDGRRVIEPGQYL